MWLVAAFALIIAALMVWIILRARVGTDLSRESPRDAMTPDQLRSRHSGEGGISGGI